MQEASPFWTSSFSMICVGVVPSSKAGLLLTAALDWIYLDVGIAYPDITKRGDGYGREMVYNAALQYAQ